MPLRKGRFFVFLDQNVYLNVYYEKEKSPETRWFQGFACVLMAGLEPSRLVFHCVIASHIWVILRLWEVVFTYMCDCVTQKREMKRVL